MLYNNSLEVNGKIINVTGTIFSCAFETSNIKIEKIDPLLPGGVKEVSTVKCNNAITFATGVYFRLYTPTDNYHVVYKKDGTGINTSLPYVPHSIPIVVTVLSGDTSIQVASKTQIAVNALGVFTASINPGDTTQVIITNAIGGDSPDIKDHNTNFIVGTTVQGEPLIIFNNSLWNDVIKVLDMNIDDLGNAEFLVLVSKVRKTSISAGPVQRFTQTKTDNYIEYRTIPTWAVILDNL